MTNNGNLTVDMFEHLLSRMRDRITEQVVDGEINLDDSVQMLYNLRGLELDDFVSMYIRKYGHRDFIAICEECEVSDESN